VKSSAGADGALPSALGFRSCVHAEQAMTVTDHRAHTRTPLIVGSGNVRERIITTPNLVRVRVAGMCRATFSVDPDFHDDITLRVRADDNVLGRVQARVRQGVIEIGLEPGAYTDLSELAITARVGCVRALASSGSAHVLLRDACGESVTLSSCGASHLHARGSARTWRIEATGNSHVHVEFAQAERVELAVADASEAALHGASELFVLNASGAARVRATTPSCTTNHARVELAGMSSARVAARRSVRGRVQVPSQLIVACPGALEISGAYRTE
jgi:hypothetical protein